MFAFIQAKEAEVTSLTHKRKIDELEAQLDEAEDVITDLRTELKLVRDKLKKVKNNQLQPWNGQITEDDADSQKTVTIEATVPSTLSSGHESVTSSDIDDTLSNQRIMDDRCCSTIQQPDDLGGSHVENLEIAPHVISKEPDLPINGIAQRIHAFESNLLEGKLPPLGDMEGQLAISNELTTKTSSKGASECIVPSSKTISKSASAEEMKKPLDFRTLRKRKNKFGKPRAALCGTLSVKSTNSNQSSSVLYRSKPCSGDKNVGSVATARMPSCQKAGIVDTNGSMDAKSEQNNNISEDGKRIIYEGKGNVAASSDTNATSSISPPEQIVKPCPSLTNSNSRMVYSFAIRGNPKPSEDRSKTAENEAKMKPLPRLDPGRTLIRRGVGSVTGRGNITVSKGLNKCSLPSKPENQVTQLDESAAGKPEGGAVKSPTGISSQTCSQTDEAPPMQSDSQDVNSLVEATVSPCKSDCNRVLKYTSERKRKKGSVANSDENTSPDNSTIKKKATVKRNVAAEPPKSSLIIESSRDSRRLAQVARQVGSFFLFSCH